MDGHELRNLLDVHDALRRINNDPRFPNINHSYGSTRKFEAASRPTQPMRLLFAAEPLKQVLVLCGDDFIGAWMPVQVPGEVKDPLELWGDDLPATADTDTTTRRNP